MMDKEPIEVTLAAMDDAENNRNMQGPYESIEELMEYLEA